MTLNEPNPVFKVTSLWR